MANNVSNPSTLNDAMHKYFCHQIPDAKIKMADLNQVLSNASAFTAATPIESRWMGNPSTVTVFVESDTAATISIYLSADGTRWYKANDTTLAASGSAVVSIPGAGYVRLVTSADITSFNSDIICNY